ncbi:MAG: carboxypeptidase-like regulatory domain-containing protein [Flammeovirgaceae bacterium]|nr:MAG: carboxypeptidase-like regulatory domain-containing protein [Flammeovirgaceae bacterium]
MVLSQPKYKPGDTLRFKAFITTRRGRPVNKDFNVNLTNYRSYPTKRKTIGQIKPYRKGAYSFEAVLNDSLKLLLDHDYYVELDDNTDNNYPGDQFRFEQYELKQNVYTLKESPANVSTKPAVLLLKATDTNDMPLFDIRCEVVVTTKTVQQYFKKLIFIPDTLWKYTFKLEPVGDTKIILPDSIYPEASISYLVTATFTNAENEWQSKQLELIYDGDSSLDVKLSDEKLIVNGPADSLQMLIIGQNENILRKKSIKLPHEERVEPYGELYYFEKGGKILKIFNLAAQNDLLQVVGNRTADSLSIAVLNPRKLQFRYQLFKNNTITFQGNDTTLDIRLRTDKDQRYYLSIQYIWAGKPQQQNYDLLFHQKSLAVSITKPATVFPGQSIDLSVSVKDALNNPVPDADLTVYAITKKFGEKNHSAVPSFEKFKPRKYFNEFYTGSAKTPVLRQKLLYHFWRERLRLDSITYYQFIYPRNGGFIVYSSTDENTTEIAPFVVRNGEVQPVYYIYFDKVLKYFHRVETLQPYSFRVDDYPNQIAIRLLDQLIILNKPPIMNGKKLIMSVDLDRLPAYATVIKMPLKLSSDEYEGITQHLIWVNRPAGLKHAYLQQGSNFNLFEPGLSYYSSKYLAGPLFPGWVTFKSDFELTFPFKAMSEYSFRSGVVDRTPSPKKIPRYLGFHQLSYSFKDLAFTENRIQAYWRSLEPKLTLQRKYPDTNPVGKRVGRLSVQQNHNTLKIKKLATYVLNLDNPDEYYIFPPTHRDLGPLIPGLYQVVIIFDDHRYLKPKPVFVKPYGTTYYNLGDELFFEADKFSEGIISIVDQWIKQSNYLEPDRKREAQSIRELYYRETTEGQTFSGGRWVTGLVISGEDGSPLPGVNVLVKGTTIGTVTDLDGNYRLYVPFNATLIFSFIGLQTQEINTSDRATIDAQLFSDVTQLSEVVVTAAGLNRAGKSMGYAVSSVNQLQGFVKGVPGSADSLTVRIRGLSSLSANNALIIVDGIITPLMSIDPSQITAIEILKGDEAVFRYGHQATNGVVLISTKPGITKDQLLQMKIIKQESLLVADAGSPGNSIRKNFRDYAFWQPRLRTDKSGQARFTTIFPDDITGWNVQALAMASKRRTGSATAQIQSFKPLIAQLSIPHFLIAGDTAWAIGKVTNYSYDSLNLAKRIQINGKTYLTEHRYIKNSMLDSIMLYGTDDSLRISYEITHNKYVDGELRKLHVLPVGTSESRGIFTALPYDTTFRLTFDHPVKSLIIRAHADVLDVLIDEIEALKTYPYECNEQLASKLIALLAEKTIRNYRKQKFEHAQSVEKVIKKLVSKQNKDGGWSWWSGGKSSLWITLHVAEALLWAERLAINVPYDKRALYKYLTEENFLDNNLSLNRWIYLLKAGEKVFINPLTDTLGRGKNYKMHYRLLTMQLNQLTGKEPDWSWITSQRKETLKGNYYWGEEKKSLWDNDIDNTLIVYQMLEKKNPDDHSLVKIRNYFLEKRNRTWRNTYESARIIEVLLPALQRAQNHSKPELVISGDYSVSITRFPFEKELDNIQLIDVKKTGEEPVYFTAYETIWNTNPKPVKNDLIIITKWKNKEKKLKTGKPVTLQINVDVKKDAEYVMIHVPIPAGCSYQSKSQSRKNGEVYREYDWHETRIYCENLHAGPYTFEIDLIPRFKGNYTLNPAKIEWMYFPVLYGRDEVRKIAIE